MVLSIFGQDTFRCVLRPPSEHGATLSSKYGVHTPESFGARIFAISAEGVDSPETHRCLLQCASVLSDGTVIPPGP